MKDKVEKIDGVISWGEIRDIWMESGRFVSYPEILQYLIEQRARVEGWPDELKDFGLEIVSKLRHLDFTTGLETPETFQKNKEMFREYTEYQKQHPDLLKPLRVVRMWGDIVHRKAPDDPGRYTTSSSCA